MRTKLARRLAVVMTLSALPLLAIAEPTGVFPAAHAPPGALDAARVAVPDATFTTVELEVEDGVITLEFHGVHADGGEVEVDVVQSWAAIEIEDRISLEDVPADVRDKAFAAAAGATFDKVEISYRGALVIFEFEGVDADGQPVDIEIGAIDGEIKVLSQAS